MPSGMPVPTASMKAMKPNWMVTGAPSAMIWLMLRSAYLKEGPKSPRMKSNTHRPYCCQMGSVRWYLALIAFSTPP